MSIVFSNLFSLHLLDEALGGFEAGEIVCGNGNRGVFRNIACRLFCPVLYDEAAEAAQIYVFSLV